MSAGPGVWRKGLVLGAHALGVWVLCAAVMGAGLWLLPLRTALAVHAIAAPVFAAVGSALYARRQGHLGPLATATFFVAFVVLVDFFLVALVINRSLDMFRSVVGTWLPFGLIFVAALVAGRAVRGAGTVRPLTGPARGAPPPAAAPPAPAGGSSRGSAAASSRRP